MSISSVEQDILNTRVMIENDSEKTSSSTEVEDNSPNSNEEITVQPKVDSKYEVADLIAIKLVEMISTQMTTKDYDRKMKEQRKSIFNFKQLPKICLGSYLKRIKDYAHCEDNTLIMGFALLKRFIRQNDILLSYMNTYKLYFICFLICMKSVEDKIHTNRHYAKVAGVELKELNKIEHEFLKMTEFNIFVSTEEYEECAKLIF